MNGLDDVIAADTALSDVDGQAGTLIIRGHSLDELAAGSTYEAVLALLWEGLFEEAPQSLAFTALLGRARSQAFERLREADVRQVQQEPVEALRIPSAQWQARGESQLLYVLLRVFLGVLGTILYVLVPRPKLR